jgi:hypothetical protein
MMQNMKIPGAQKSSGPRKQTSAEAPDEERCELYASSLCVDMLGD